MEEPIPHLTPVGKAFLSLKGEWTLISNLVTEGENPYRQDNLNREQQWKHLERGKTGSHRVRWGSDGQHQTAGVRSVAPPTY